MTDISNIANQAELNQLILKNKIQPVWSNVYIDNRRYQIVCVEGKCHSIGGGFGDNCYWGYPADEPLRFENLIAFNGHTLSWGIISENHNYTRHKWNETTVHKGCRTWVTLNGQKLLSVSGFMDYALPKAQSIIIELSEGNINFLDFNWREQIIGRKVFLNNEPAIIESICSNDLDLILVPDGIEYFSPPCWTRNAEDFDVEMWKHESGTSYKAGLLSPNIYWHRD